MLSKLVFFVCVCPWPPCNAGGDILMWRHLKRWQEARRCSKAHQYVMRCRGCQYWWRWRVEFLYGWMQMPDCNSCHSSFLYSHTILYHPTQSLQFLVWGRRQALIFIYWWISSSSGYIVRVNTDTWGCATKEIQSYIFVKRRCHIRNFF